MALQPRLLYSAGGGDASAIGVGAGSVAVGDTHITAVHQAGSARLLTSRLLMQSAMMAAIVGADPGKYNYFGELETSNKCVGMG